MNRGIFYSILGTVIFLQVSCASSGTRKLIGSELTPAAEGEVTLQKVANNNSQVNLEVKHLAPPSRISSGATTYIVWLEPLSGNTQAFQNIGALQVDQDLSGRFSTVIPHRNFKLFVTPESSPLVDAPSGERIFEAPIHEMAE